MPHTVQREISAEEEAAFALYGKTASEGIDDYIMSVVVAADLHRVAEDETKRGELPPESKTAIADLERAQAAAKSALIASEHDKMRDAKDAEEGGK